VVVSLCSELEAAHEPSERARHALEAENMRLEEANKQLSDDLAAWKKRVDGLISKFNQVDPEEHKKLLENFEKLKQSHDEAVQSHRAE
jgi:predicted nuclease with TOPRIM domain